MRLLILLAFGCILLCADNSVSIDWVTDYGQVHLSCGGGGNPAHCSTAAVAFDPDFGVDVTFRASAFAFTTESALTIHLDYSPVFPEISGFCCDAMTNSLYALADFSYNSGRITLSRPAPLGSYAEFDTGFNDAVCNPGQSYSISGVFVLSGSFSCAPDGHLIQAVEGNNFSISGVSEIEQDLIRNLGLDETTPVDVTYSIQNVQVFDPAGRLIPGTITPVPEPNSVWLLFAGLLLTRFKMKGSRSRFS